MKIEEQIIRLLENDLSANDRAGLEKLLEENPELKKERALYEQIILAIREKGEAELRIDLDGYLKEYIEGKERKKLIPFNKYIFYGGIAASLSLIMLFFYQTKNNADITNETPMMFEINEAPVHADSATLERDSLQNVSDSLKKAKSSVDNF